MMSYMGSIGAIMRGSGLEESLQTIYGSNAVDHIISGKAVSSATRAHCFKESATRSNLSVLLLNKSSTPNRNILVYILKVVIGY